MPAEGESGGSSHGSGYDDVWVAKLDAAGAIEWRQLPDGSQSDYGCEIEPTADGEPDDDLHGRRSGWVRPLAANVVRAMPDGPGGPPDLDLNGRYEDMNRNERKNFPDVVLFVNQMTWIAANEPMTAFDCNGNGRIDFADVVWLFNHL